MGEFGIGIENTLQSISKTEAKTYMYFSRRIYVDKTDAMYIGGSNKYTHISPVRRRMKLY